MKSLYKGDKFSYHHCTDRETEAQSTEMSCPDHPEEQWQSRKWTPLLLSPSPVTYSLGNTDSTEELTGYGPDFGNLIHTLLHE